MPQYRPSLQELRAEAKQKRIIGLEAKAEDRRKRKNEKIAAAHAKRNFQIQLASGPGPEMQELALRTLQRRHLIDFVLEFHPRYKAGWVHRDICARLEKFAADVAAGKSPRLMILMPPRHGKSQLASRLYPAWHLGHYPEHEFIACSYSIDLARDFSREVRSVLRTPRYDILFPKTKLDPDFQSAETWKLLAPGLGAGGYVAAGVGGGITGKGAHVLVIDDPFKNAEEAESPEIRKKVWSWYQSTAYTRLAPGGGVLLIQTWWHDDDLAGRIMQDMKDDPEADQFEIVKYPAIAEEDEQYRKKGEALHSDRYTLEQLMKIKRTIGLQWWSALYQQNPVPADGAYFTREMFVYREDRPNPEYLYIYQAWDFAISEKKRADWNVGITVGVDFDDNVHVLEVVRFKTTDGLKIVNEMLDMYERHEKVQGIGAEDGQIWKTLSTLFLRRARERRLYPVITPLLPVTDKEVRARPLQGRMQQRKVTFQKNAPYMEAVWREMLRFPSGVHDDIIDALAWVVTLTLGRAAPRKPKIRNKLRQKTVAQKLRLFGRLAGGTHMGN